MSWLEQWREMARAENERMQPLWFNPPCEPSESVAQRRAEIVRLAGEGLSMQEIADRLGMKIATVKTDFYRGRKA